MPGCEQESIFEYELPLNFKHDCDITDTFYAIKMSINDQYFGFKLQNAQEKKSLVKQMKYLAKLLHKSKRQIHSLLKNYNDAKLDQMEFPDQLEEIFGSDNHEQKLSDLYDMLVEQGMD